MVVIRLKRMGRKKHAFYRVVVMDSKTKREGRAIEELGYYAPQITSAEKQIQKFHINKERFDYWVSQGGVPSEKVSYLVKLIK